MKVEITKTYMVDISGKALEEVTQEFLEEEVQYNDLSEYQSVADVAIAVAMYLVSESEVGNYNKFVSETNIEHQVLEVAGVPAQPTEVYRGYHLAVVHRGKPNMEVHIWHQGEFVDVTYSIQGAKKVVDQYMEGR
jgi:hypothetical protein